MVRLDMMGERVGRWRGNGFRGTMEDRKWILWGKSLSVKGRLKDVELKKR